MSPEPGLIGILASQDYIFIFAFKGLINYPDGSLENNLWVARYCKTREWQLSMVGESPGLVIPASALTSCGGLSKLLPLSGPPLLVLKGGDGDLDGMIYVTL